MTKQSLLTASAAVLLFAAVGTPAAAQSSAGSQSSESSSTQAGASAGPANTQAQSSTSAVASQSAEASRDKNEKDRGHEASGSAVASAANSRSAAANAGPAAIQLQDTTDVHAVLTKSLDSRKCKPGDPVMAKVTEDVKEDGQVVMHKGTHLMGHVTQAQARGKSRSQSSLGIAFDHARMKNGQEVPLQLGVQALAAAQTASTAAVDNEAFASAGAMGAASGGARAGGGLLGGAGSAVGGTVGGAAGAANGAVGGVGHTVGAVGGTASAATSATGSVTSQAGGLNAAGQLMSNSSGVFGLHGLNLTSNLSNATQGPVITSAGKSVQLSSGTQMLLHVSKQ